MAYKNLILKPSISGICADKPKMGIAVKIKVGLQNGRLTLTGSGLTNNASSSVFSMERFIVLIKYYLDL